MKKNYPLLSRMLSGLIFFLLLSFVSLKSFSQCPPNYNFEDSTTNGWLCKSGYYGGGPYPMPQVGFCPSFQTILPAANNGTCINAGGRNAALNTYVDRHTIVSMAYYGNGIDPNSLIPPLQVVDPMGGNYSFRLGDSVPGGVVINGKNYARAEAIRLTFRVDPSNARFTYRYAAFLQDPGHLPEEQPRFEVLVTDSLDSLLPCGYYKVVAGSSNPSCGTGTNSFHPGRGNWRYTDWTSVALDFTSYYGQLVNIEFRTSDCFPCAGTNCNGCSTIVNGVCTTVCCNGVCCTSANCGGGCTGTVPNLAGSHSAYVYLDAICQPAAISVPPVCSGQSVTLHAPSGYCSYSWLPGGATTDSLVVPNPIPGTTYTINMVSCTGVTTIPGCPAQTTVTINGTGASVRDTMFCAGTAGNVQLNVSATATGTPTYTWSGPGGFSSTIPNPVITIPNTTSVYTIVVQDTTSAHCTITITDTVHIYPVPVINTVPNPSICAGGSALLSASAGAGGPYSYLWLPNNVLSDTLTVSPGATQTYTVVVVDSGHSTNCTASATVTVNVSTNPTPGVTANPPAICQGQNSQLSTGAIPGGHYSWTTSGGNTLPDTSNSPIVAPTITTTYTVYVTANGCQGSNSVVVTVNQPPAINTDPVAICVGSNAQLSSTANLNNYAWISFPPGLTFNNGTTNAPTVINPAAGTYLISVTADLNGCQNSDTTILTVNATPVLAAQTSPICVGSNGSLSATFDPTYGYNWTAPGGINLNNSGIGTPSVLNPPAGSYTFTVNVTDSNSCQNSATTTLIVNPTPPVTAVTTNVCSGSNAQVSATFDATYGYTWTSPSGLTVNGSNTNVATVVSPPAGTYTFTIAVIDTNTCTNDTTVTLTVNPPPTVNAISPNSICVGANAQLTATNNAGYQYAWVSSPATAMNGANTSMPTVVTPPVGTYTFTVGVVDGNTCVNAATTSLTVNPLPVVTVSSLQTVCLGSCATITAGGGVQCAWSGNLNGCTPQVCPSAAGLNSYRVTVTDGNGCSDTSTAYVNVNPLPIINVSPGVTICQDSSTVLTATGATSYTWSPTQGLTSPNADTTTATPAQTTTYSVTGTNANNCTATTSVTVAVVPPPNAFLRDTFVCFGHSVQLKASGGLYFSWAPDSTLSSLITGNPVATPSATTTYYVTVSNGGNCPPATDSVTVVVYPIPPIFAGTDTTILAGDTTVLTAGGGGISYNWSPETGLNCNTCPSVFAYPIQTTLYIVTTTDINGCRNSDSVLVKVDDVLTLYIPNAFMPDPHNDFNNMFYAYGIGIYKFEFYIFDRWGNRIFESFNPSVGWDGTYLGKQVQQDVYVYLAKARSITGKTITKTGSVTVVR